MKKTKKPFKVFLTMCVILLSCILVSVFFAVAVNGYMIISGNNKIITNESSSGQYDCVLILGAGVRPDKTPSAMLAERLSCGLEAYEKGLSGKIIVTGDHGTVEYDEVSVMKRWLMDRGVPSEDIFMDHAGFSTYDSIYRAKEIFGAEKILVITQKYHLYRALYIASSLGIEAEGVDAARVTYKGQTLRDIREAAARVKDFFSGVFKLYPKYLGEEIPLSESGDVTNDTKFTAEKQYG